jgi:hypothetical protein
MKRLLTLLLLLILPSFAHASTLLYSQLDDSYTLSGNGQFGPSSDVFSPSSTNTFDSITLETGASGSNATNELISIYHYVSNVYSDTHYACGVSPTLDSVTANNAIQTFNITNWSTSANCTSPTSLTLNSSDTYQINLGFASGSHNYSWKTDSTGSHNLYVFVYSGFSSTFPTYRTNFWQVVPFDHAFVQSTTTVTFNAIGYLIASDAASTPHAYVQLDLINWQITGPTHVILTFPDPTPVGGIAGSFNVSTSTILGIPDGTYTATWRILRKDQIFGVTYDTQTLDSTTTAMFVGNYSAYQQYWDSIASSSGNFFGSQFASTTASVNDCLSFHLADCVSALVIPNGATLQKFSSLFDSISNKPPFGYFTLVKNAFAGATTSTSTESLGITAFRVILTPINAIFALILWLLFALWIFRRFTHFDFQA